MKERENAWNDYLKQLGKQRVSQMLKEGKTPEEISYFTEHLVQIQLDIILFAELDNNQAQKL